MTPSWGHTGRELFYPDANRQLTSIAVQSGGPFGLGAPQSVLRIVYGGGAGACAYDISRDDQRFLFFGTRPGPDSATLTIVVVLNAFSASKDGIGLN